VQEAVSGPQELESGRAASQMAQDSKDELQESYRGLQRVVSEKESALQEAMAQAAQHAATSSVLQAELEGLRGKTEAAAQVCTPRVPCSSTELSCILTWTYFQALPCPAGYGTAISNWKNCSHRLPQPL
jgi:hypothetical protein